MADLLDGTNTPDVAEIEAGNMRSTADAIALLWGQLQSLLTAERPSFLIDGSRIINFPTPNMFTFVGSISFGSTDTVKQSNLNVDAATINDLALTFLGPWTYYDAIGMSWDVWGIPISATLGEFYRTPASDGAQRTHDPANLGSLTAYFQAIRLK
jgi:hypothetical protein